MEEIRFVVGEIEEDQRDRVKFNSVIYKHSLTKHQCHHNTFLTKLDSNYLYWGLSLLYFLYNYLATASM